MADISLYLTRAHKDLEAARSNLEHGFYAVSVTRAYYAMFYAASALLAREILSDALRFVERATQYLDEVGAL